MKLLTRSFLPSGCIACLCVVLTVLGCSRSDTAKSLRIEPGEYVVQAGDDLTSIAIRAYGDGSVWYGLLNANPYLSNREGFSLGLGEAIQIPEKDKLDTSLPKSIFPIELPADYIVMPGDSLHFIAQGCYNSRDKWMLIYEANRDILSERVKRDTRQLVAGQLLRIPKEN
jgi:nucleoid-associated protein YgaU